MNVASPALRGKPRLTLDVSPLLESQWTGIPVFTRRLAQALSRSGRLELGFACHLAGVEPGKVAQAIQLNTGAYLADEILADEGREPTAIDPGAPVLYPSNKGRASGLLKREGSTVHDLTTLFMPDTHDEGNVAHHLDHLEAELDSDEAIFCISEATRGALVAAKPSTASRIRLIPQYVDWPESFALIDRNLPELRPRRYAVVVGTIEPRKNLKLLIDALAHRDVARHDLLFIVIGRKGWLVDQFLERLNEDQRRSVIFSGFVSEFLKYRLIKNAEFLIFPSLCEGFGIPALEAMSLGKPVLAARASSLPEVVGEAGVYFDPFSVDEFAAALGEIAHPAKLAELAPRALRRCAAFTPEKMAEPVLRWATE